jgi:hypothetical protein
VQGEGKGYFGRLVMPSAGPVYGDVILHVPGFGTLQTLNCQSDGANAMLVDIDESRGAVAGWRDGGDADPAFYANLGNGGTTFNMAERTSWHLSVGTGGTVEVAEIELYTAVAGPNCIYSATAHVWGR